MTKIGWRTNIFPFLRSPLNMPYRQASINRENLEIQKHLHDLYAKEANFDKWLDNTDKYLRDLAQQDVRECNLDLYAYARAVVEYHRYMRRQKNKRHSLEIPQSELESPFLSTRLRADHTKDLGAILRASDRPELPADQQQFLEFFSEQSKRGQRLRRLEEAAYSRLYNLKTSERVDEGIAKTLGERFGLRAAADGYQRAALQAVLRKHIYHKEQYYVGSWENNIVRLPWKTRPRLVAKLEGQKRDYYPWTNKFLRFENRRFEDADKTRALRELVRPLCNNEAVPDDIAITLIRTKILNENIVPDSDSSTAKPEPASQVWGFPLPDELKPVQPEDYFGPEKITVTNGGKRKATTGHGPRSKRPRHDSYSSSEDESKYGEIPLGFGKIMPPEIKNYWLSPGDQAKAKNLDEKEKICSFDGLPFFYLAETNHLAVLKSKHLKDVEGHLEKWEIAQQSKFFFRLLAFSAITPLSSFQYPPGHNFLILFAHK